ncbi:hypothetical protein ACHAXS_008294 [Conticribra weissflogii]
MNHYHCRRHQDVNEYNQARWVHYCLGGILLLLVEAKVEGLPFKRHVNHEHCPYHYPVDRTLFIAPSFGFKPMETPKTSLKQNGHPKEHSSGRRWKNKRKRNKFLPAPDRSIASHEEMALLQQLGYVPPNVSCVSARSGEVFTLSSDLSIPVVSAETNKVASTIAIDTSSMGIGRPIAIRSYPLLIQLANMNDNHCDTYESNANTPSNERNNILFHHNSSRRATITTPFPTLYWLTCPHISKAISELERHGFVREFQSRLESNDSLANRWLDCHEEYAKERWNVLSSLDREWLSLKSTVEERDSNGDKGICESERRKIQSMRDMIQYSGVAGTDHRGLKQTRRLPRPQPHSNDGDGDGDDKNVLFVPSVKCLHSHYAHYRSQLSRIYASHEENVDAENGRGSLATLNVVGEWTHQLLMKNFPDLII